MVACSKKKLKMCAFEPADQSLKNRLYGKHLDSTNPNPDIWGGGASVFFCRILGYRPDTETFGAVHTLIPAKSATLFYHLKNSCNYTKGKVMEPNFG